METREDQIKRLKRNKEAFGLLPGNDQKLLNHMKKYHHDYIRCFTVDKIFEVVDKGEKCFPIYTYRIAQGYNEEQEKLLDFDIDWNGGDTQGCFYVDGVEHSLGDEYIEKGNLKYYFKHHEYDVDGKEALCSLSFSEFYDTCIERIVPNLSYSKNLEDRFKTVRAKRIVFELGGA